eukprot:116208-Pelagomonas_calceolata.AAC.1
MVEHDGTVNGNKGNDGQKDPKAKALFPSFPTPLRPDQAIRTASPTSRFPNQKSSCFARIVEAPSDRFKAFSGRYTHQAVFVADLQRHREVVGKLGGEEQLSLALHSHTCVRGSRPCIPLEHPLGDTALLLGDFLQQLCCPHIHSALTAHTILGPGNINLAQRHCSALPQHAARREQLAPT